MTLTGTDPNSVGTAADLHAEEPSRFDGTLNGSGPDLTYTPDPGYQGADRLYRPHRQATAPIPSAEATVRLDVAAGSPTADEQEVNVEEDSSADAITLTGSDPTDPPPPALTYTR